MEMLNTIDKKLTSAQLRTLKSFGSRITKFGVNFAVCNSQGQIQLLCQSDKLKSSDEQLVAASAQVLSSDKSATGNSLGISKPCPVLHNDIMAVELNTNSGKADFAVMIDLGKEKSQDSTAEYFAEILTLFIENFNSENKTFDQLETISVELSQTYEELMLLHKLSTNMKVTESNSNFLQMACDNLTDIMTVGGVAILLEKFVDGTKKMVLVAGLGVIDIDEENASMLYSRLLDELSEGKEALLDSEVDGPFKYDWPATVKNIIAVPLCGKSKDGTRLIETNGNEINAIGMMVAVNIIGKDDFNCPDIKLLNSVANSCAVFIENGNLFKDLKELFIGSLKALTNSIDAKDKYTRGHSERVAFISKWIAEKYSQTVEPLDESEIHKIYLAGLLHDIGKMGVDESVLRKEGKLNDIEYDHIKMHPSIGQSILSGIKQMQEIVPGVLCHHERIDGRGYPEGLKDDQIPFIGKIVSIADSFDAMTSRRTYRNAMTLEKAIFQIEEGLGTQFDETLGKVFIQSNIKRLWLIIQDGFIDEYTDTNFAEYGAVAVGTLLR